MVMFIAENTAEILQKMNIEAISNVQIGRAHV